jgi:hypothetical protein
VILRLLQERGRVQGDAPDDPPNPGFISKNAWCRLFANGQRNVQPGMNWDFNPYFAPWWRYECGWVRWLRANPATESSTAWPGNGTILMNGDTET